MAKIDEQLLLMRYHANKVIKDLDNMSNIGQGSFVAIEDSLRRMKELIKEILN